MSALTLPLLRALSVDRFTSGEALATRFGVTRSAVSAALKQSERLGVQVFSLTRKGYRLAAPVDLLSLEAIHTALGAGSRRLDVHLHDQIDSTNTALLAMLSTGAPSGTTVVAEIQTAGRGRRGRVWQSSLGQSLTFSLLWRFECGVAALGGLSLAVGLAVHRALTSLGVNSALKWPNDVWIDQRKCGGILIETQGEMMGPVSAVIGIGLNVRVPDQTLAAIDQPATDIERHLAAPITRSALLAKLLASLVVVLDEFSQTGFVTLRDEWKPAHALQGANVDIINPHGLTQRGEVVDVQESGALLVRIDGQLKALSSEEVSLRGAQ